MQQWIIPCNLKMYDVFGAFSNLKAVEWKQSNRNIAIGNIIYVYVGAPICAIKFKCRVNRVNFSCHAIDDSAYVLIGDIYENYGNYMELELIKEYDADSLTLTKMQTLGLKGCIQSTRKLPVEFENIL